MPERLPGIYEILLEERQDSPNTIVLYLIKGSQGQRNLLIDAAYSSGWCLNQLLSALDELKIPIDTLDVFLTHKHADHCGLARCLQDHGAVIYMNREEDRHQYDCLYYRQDRSNENAQLRVLRRNGITPEHAPLIWEKFMEVNRNLGGEHSVWMMTMEQFDYQDILPGQLFCYGDYRLQAVPLRGHTYGQMGLVDPEKKLFFSADQVLNRTTPIVGTSHCDEHLLKHYRQSLQGLVDNYSDHLILPPHEGPIENLSGSVQRILGAYEKKTAQVLAAVLPDREQTVWQIAKQVYGLVPDGLTPTRGSDPRFYHSKLITTKTFSMLEYLYDTGKVIRREEDGMLFWKAAE